LIDSDDERWLHKQGAWSLVPIEQTFWLAQEVEQRLEPFRDMDINEGEGTEVSEPMLDRQPSPASRVKKGKVCKLPPLEEHDSNKENADLGGACFFNFRALESAEILGIIPIPAQGPPSVGAPPPELSTPAHQAEVVEQLLTTMLGWLKHVQTSLVPLDRWESICTLAIAVEAAVPWLTLSSSSSLPPPPGMGLQASSRVTYETKWHAAGWAQFIALKQLLVDMEVVEAANVGQPVSAVR
jgi:hypothetical protein